MSQFKQLDDTKFRSDVTEELEQVRILYVEDDPAFADLGVTCLEDENDRFSLTTAADATTGLELLTEDIDCIVSDYNMPGMNGIEFLEAVRETYPKLPFILFTGKGSEEVASDAISAGVTDYLQKEGGTDQFTILANRITNAVEKQQTQEQLVRQNERLDTVVRNAPLILFALDSEGVFTFSEGQGLAEIDMEPGAVVGDSVFDVFAGDDDILAAAEQALDGDQTTATHEVADSIFKTTYNPVFDDDGTVSAVTGVAVDITERKQRERRFEALVEESNDIISILDADGVFQYNSPSLERILGHDPEETIGDTAWEYMHPDDREDVVDTFEEWMADPETTAMVEYRAQHADGSWRWMEARGTNQRDNPTVEGYVVNSRDITDRKEREEQVQRERHRYATLFETLPNPVLHAGAEDVEPVIQNVNSAFERVFGYDAETLKGERLHDYILPDDQIEEVEQLNHRILDEGGVRTEVRRETTGGVRTFRLDINTRNEGGKQPEGYAIYTDITDRVERERELEILRTAIDRAHIPLALTDPSRTDNPLVYVNDAFEEVTGYSRSEAIGNNCRFLHGEQTDPEKVAVLRDAIENEEPATVDLRNYRKDGTMFWNRVTIRPIYDDDGELLRYFRSQQDITRSRRSDRGSSTRRSYVRGCRCRPDSNSRGYPSVTPSIHPRRNTRNSYSSATTKATSWTSSPRWTPSRQ